MRLARTVLSGATTVLVIALLVPAASAQTPSNPGVVRDGDAWHLRESLSGGPATTSFRYGRAGDRHLMCDWNGDGLATPGVVRYSPGGSPRWHLRNSHRAGAADVSFAYGRDRDWAVCGDWDGDGTDTPGMVRQRANGLFDWYLKDSLSGGAADVTFTYGRSGPRRDPPPTWPVTGDWNGDGTDTPGLVRGTEAGQMRWLLRDANAGGVADHAFTYYGGAVWGDHLEVHYPIVGDWNGDGRDGPGAIRGRNAANPQWLLRNDRSGGPADHVFRYGRHLDATVTW